MRTLSIDLETYSDIDLLKTGVYPYTESPAFEILLFAYAFDGEAVQVVDFASGGTLPPEVIRALTDSTIVKTAFNANFELTCLRGYGYAVDVSQWQCTAVHASMLGLPSSLEAVATALKLTEGKMSEGKNLINYFSKPCKPTKVNGGRTRNLPEHAPEKWATFIEYCRRDVEVEREIKRKISFFQVPPKEWALWRLDQKINNIGVLVNLTMVRNAIACNLQCKKALAEEAIALTRIANPNSTTQLKAWLERKLNRKIASIDKESVDALLAETNDTDVVQLLTIRKRMSRSSVKKYEAMARTVCNDTRIRGALKFYGANRTGRWAGSHVQVHNLPKNSLLDLDLARRTLLAGRYDDLDMLFGDTQNVLSELVRTAFIAGEGKTFIVADFSAIEARVIAWLAGEDWRLEVFRTHGKIYEASAAQMFHVPLDSITKGSPLRQKGKVAELALGYQGSPAALVRMGALKGGLTEEDLPGLVDSWRKANKKIVKLWSDTQKKAIEAVAEKTTTKLPHGIRFTYQRGVLFIQLPSGRRLSYLRARVADSDFGKKIVYEGVNQDTKHWQPLDTYGGKLVENITQAIARDCLAEAMRALDAAGYKIVMHVHDEVVIECDKANAAQGLKGCAAIMGRELPWAKGLPLRADAYETEYYKKD